MFVQKIKLLIFSQKFYLWISLYFWEQNWAFWKRLSKNFLVKLYRTSDSRLTDVRQCSKLFSKKVLRRTVVSDDSIRSIVRHSKGACYKEAFLSFGSEVTVVSDTALPFPPSSKIQISFLLRANFKKLISQITSLSICILINI